MNTKSSGLVTIVTAQPSDSSYFVGFVYELGIVLENQDREQLLADLREAARGYIRVVRENNLHDDLLDKHEQLPKDLQDLYEVAKAEFERKQLTKVKVPRQYKVSLNMGLTQLSTACV